MRYEFDDSESVIEFPLFFCPQESNGFIKQNISCTNLCQGQWGLVFKVLAIFLSSHYGNLSQKLLELSFGKIVSQQILALEVWFILQRKLELHD